VVLAPRRAASACARHNVIALDLPAADESAGLDVYADLIVKTIGDRPDVVLVAHSMGAFPATMVCERASVASLVRVVP
jgi:pimeloyl-ACP methyl ester carboxylesterase